MFLFTAETQMMCEVEAIRDGWRALHVCQRDEEKSRDLNVYSPAHTNAQAHAPDTAAVKAITMIQTGPWEMV